MLTAATTCPCHRDRLCDPQYIGWPSYCCTQPGCVVANFCASLLLTASPKAACCGFESKFHKSRILPLSPDAHTELRRYLQKRLAPPFSKNLDTPLLINTEGGLRPYTGTGISGELQVLFKAAGVEDSEGRHPRVHDLRHSFAVGALIRWYLEGADVQSNLPKLALYMGHARSCRRRIACTSFRSCKDSPATASKARRQSRQGGRGVTRQRSTALGRERRALLPGISPTPARA